MKNASIRPPRLRPLAACTSALAIALLVGLASTSLDGPASPSADQPAPTYAGLRPVFQAGEGKQIDDGVFEIWCNVQGTPSGWLWGADDTRDGNGREYWILHSAFLYPGPDNDGVTLTFDYLSNQAPVSVSELVAWIVETYDHVSSADELAIHECKVRRID